MAGKRIGWPTAAVLIGAIAAVAATAILGPMTGLEDETLRYVLGGEGAAAAIVLGLMRPVAS